MPTPSTGRSKTWMATWARARSPTTRSMARPSKRRTRPEAPSFFKSPHDHRGRWSTPPALQRKPRGASAQRTSPRSKRGENNLRGGALALGLTGGIIGLIAAVIALAIGGLGGALTSSADASTQQTFGMVVVGGWIALGASIVGVIGGALAMGKP